MIRIVVFGAALSSSPSFPPLAVFRIFSRSSAWITLTALALGIVGPTGRPLAADDSDDPRAAFFESKIRPVLVKHCYACHSAEAREIKGGLRLDTAAGLLEGGDSGPALVAGKPGESLLIEALRFDGLEMPPSGRLSASVVANFERWVERGAYDPRTEGASSPDRPTAVHKLDIEQGRQFWSFQPVRRPTPPAVAQSDWPRSAIDAFVLARLESAGLPAPPAADAATRLRRLCFDLTGLPPTPEQLAAFSGDSSPAAYEALVDRLLQSPHFGEHWGRHWLDVARYADSNGGDFNATFHDAWRYRDYVFQVFNEDRPYDQFIREQLAGDLLPSDSDAQRIEQLVATSFLMLGAKMLSERDKEKLQMDVVDDQINAVGAAFLGMTLGCARCHDHKFDPIPTEDYYALAGIFRSSRTLEGESQKYVSTWRRTTLPADASHVAEVKSHEEGLRKLQARRAAAKKQLAAAERQQRQFEQRADPLLVDDEAAERTGDWTRSTFTPGFIGTGYIHDNREGKGEKSVRFTIPIAEAGRYEVRLAYPGSAGRSAAVPIRIEHAEGAADVSLDETRKGPIEGRFAALGQFRFEPAQPARVTVSNRGTTGYVIVDAIHLVRLDEQGQPVAPGGDAGPPSSEADASRAAVEKWKRELAAVEAQIKAAEENPPRPLPKAMAISEFASVGDCEICIRGEHRNRGATVPRGFLQVAPAGAPTSIAENESGRRELADWIASAENPLTARVVVNRVWSHLLGEGIVRSVDNFGQLGQRPTHPELLDYLAARFTASSEGGPAGEPGWGWSIKSLVREIVLSRAYQSSSRFDAAAADRDPENKLLWRAHRRRLPAEAIRDSLLAVSGQLDLTPGGSPVEGLGVLVTQNSASPEAYRARASFQRSAYLPMIRSELPQFLTAFDFADPDLVVGKRPVTNVPAQALLLLNSPLVMQCAAETARRMLAAGGEQDPAALAEQAYQIVLSRRPDDEERRRAAAFLEAAASASAPADSTPADSTPADSTPAAAAPADETPAARRLTRLIHALFASTEFRMLD